MLNYSVENLRQLMASSPAYQSLSVEEKGNIEAHIQQNNKSVLLYVFQNLQEEADAHQISRENLAKKILKIPAPDLQEIKTLLKTELPPSP